MKKLISLLVIITAIACATAFAQEVVAPAEVTPTTTAPATSSKPRFDIGAGYWYTWGDLDTELVAITSLPGYYLAGDKVSELNYDTDGGMFVVNAEAYLFWRIYADALVAWGDMEGGEQIDSDWLWQISTEKWMESKADAEGDMTLFNVNGYVRILEEAEDKGYLDAAVGYLYYQDDVESMTNLVYTIEDWVATNDPYAGLDSSDKYTFDGLRIGARAKIRLHDRVAIKASAGFIPWLDVERDGNWNLRESPNTPGLLGMDINGDADGTGFDVGIGIEIKITKNLFVEVGYKYLDFDSDEGDYSHSWSDGAKFTYEDGWESTEAGRGGFYAMGRLKI